MIVACFLLFLLFYTWIIYPGLMLFAFRKGNRSQELFHDSKDILPLTIVMFLHNEEDVLDNSLKALQTCPDYLWDAEFVIISDASTDGSHEIIRRFQVLDKRFTLIQSDQRLGKPGQWHKHQNMLWPLPRPYKI